MPKFALYDKKICYYFIVNDNIKAMEGMNL